MARKEYEMCYVEDTGDEYIIGFLGSENNIEFIKNIIFLEFSIIEGGNVSVEDELISAEAMKGVSSLRSPIEGEVIALNHEIEEDPEKLAEAPETWLIKIKK